MRMTWSEFENVDLPKRSRSIMSNDGKSRTLFYDDTRRVMVITDRDGVTVEELDK